MKKLFKSLIWLIIIAISAVVLFTYLFSKKNNTSFSLNTIDLKLDCSQLDDFVVTKTVNVSVENLSSRMHSNISVKVVALDENGNKIAEKYTTFLRDLTANESFSKPVSFPAKTSSCSCEIVSSNPS